MPFSANIRPQRMIIYDYAQFGIVFSPVREVESRCVRISNLPDDRVFGVLLVLYMRVVTVT